MVEGGEDLKAAERADLELEGPGNPTWSAPRKDEEGIQLAPML